MTPVRGVHVPKLRASTNRLRAQYGLGAFGWSRSTAISRGPVLKEHLTDLRAALNQAYQAAGRAGPAYAEAIVARETTIKASHLNR